MFGLGATSKKLIQPHWWSILLVLSAISGVVSTPLQHTHRLEINVRRELQSLTPGAEIPRKFGECSKNTNGGANFDFRNSFPSGPTRSIGEPFGTVGSWYYTYFTIIAECTE
jgi:hypothetical protein